MIQSSRVVPSSQPSSSAPVGTVVPPSHGKRISGRTLMVTFLCLVLLVGLTGGVWTFLVQQRLLNSQYITVTPLATTFAAATSGAQFGSNSASVVGPPTLPAETVNSILAGTPMAGLGAVIEEASRNTNIDDAFALAVWWADTNGGAAGVGLSYRNPGGVRGSAPVGEGGYTIYPSYTDAIYDWFNIIESRYINRGLTSVYTISYPYVGTSGAASWANKVFNLMVRYRAMVSAPALSPTSIPTRQDNTPIS